MDDSGHSRYLPRHPREWGALAAACVGMVWLFGDDLWMQVKRARESLRDSMRENVSVELEIERARATASSLIPDIRRNQEIIIREQVEIDGLRNEIGEEQRSLERQREELVKLRSRLPTAESPQQAAVPAVRRDLRKELQRRFAIYQSADATLSAKLEILHSREQSLVKAEAAHEEVLSKRLLLEAQVTNLETRLKALGTDGVENRVHVNREKLAQCEELIRYLRGRLAVAERLTRLTASKTEMRGEESGPIDDDFEIEIDRYLARGIQSQK